MSPAGGSFASGSLPRRQRSPHPARWAPLGRQAPGGSPGEGVAAVRGAICRPPLSLGAEAGAAESETQGATGTERMPRGGRPIEPTRTITFN